MALAGTMGCDEKEPPTKSDRAAPIPTTPEHRKPMSASEVKRFEGVAAMQIKEHKKELVAKCYEPIKAEAPDAPAGKVDPDTLKKAAAGASQSITVMIVFDEEGKEATREVTEQSEVPTGLARCVGEHLPPISVPAPKRKVRIKVPLSFP